MLNRIFNVENRFWTFANKLADVIILELAWLVTSLPILTIGAASTAFWHVVLLIAEDQEGRILGTYFRMFRKSLKQGTVLWACQLGTGVFLFLDIFLCAVVMKGAAGYILTCVFGVLGIMWLLASMFLYPIAGRFHFPTRKILGNSFFLALRHLPHTIVMILLVAAAAVGSVRIPYMIIYLPPIVLYINAKIYLWIFSLYMEDTGEEEAEENGGAERMDEGAGVKETSGFAVDAGGRRNEQKEQT